MWKYNKRITLLQVISVSSQVQFFYHLGKDIYKIRKKILKIRSRNACIAYAVVVLFS